MYTRINQPAISNDIVLLFIERAAARTEAEQDQSGVFAYRLALLQLHPK